MDFHMILKKGVDLTLHTINEYHIVSIKTFPVSLYGNQPYRNATLDNLNFKIPKSKHSIEDAIELIFDTIKSIKDNDKCNLIFYTTKDSLEYNILNNSEYKNSIQFHGCKIKKDKLKELKDNYLETYSFKPTIEELSDKLESFIFLDCDFNTEELFKTHEITISKYNNEKDLLANSNSVFENHHISNSLEKSNHDWFIEVVEPHVKAAYEDGKQVYIQAKTYHMPYVFSLNNSLKKQNIEPVSMKTRRNPQYKIKKELSYDRIRKHMTEKYDDLINLNDKYVFYCDGATVLLEEEGILNSSAFIFKEKNKKDVDFVIRKKYKNNSDQIYAEINALVFAIDFVIDNNKTDKPIHFVFDSDYVYKSFEATVNNNKDRVSDRCKDIFEDISIKIKEHNLVLSGVLLKSHQLSEANKKKHPVVLYNEKVDMLAKKNLFKEAQKIKDKKSFSLKK